VFGATLVQAVAWIAGTAVGVTIGVKIPAPEDFGFDTIFPACYLALLWPELRGAQARLAALLGAGIALAILAGRAGQVAAAIRRKATCAGLNPHARKGADPWVQVAALLPARQVHHPLGCTAGQRVRACSRSPYACT
jgi:predicted branched-subunit amino acid permease